MNITEFEFGFTQLNNPLLAQRSTNFYNEKWLYLIAGVHGNEIEGISLSAKITTWLKDANELTFPCIIIPILDIDGHLYQDQVTIDNVNLNHLFPISSLRISRSKGVFTSSNILPPEISSLIDLLRKYPPQMIINLRTASTGSKVISVGDDALGPGSFLAKTTGYPLISDNQPLAGTLEAFIYDFFLCPIVTLRLPHYSDKKTVNDISQDNLKGIQLLLSGQIY